MYTYEVYTGAKNATWAYKTYTWLDKRLRDLAATSALGKVTVVARSKTDTRVVDVRFERVDRKNYRWDAGPKGIPTSNTLNKVAFSRGPHFNKL